MERLKSARWRLPLTLAAGVVAAFLLRRVLTALGIQLAVAAVMMLAALPLCRWLERRMPPTAAALLALLLLGAAAALALMLLVPPILRQVKQLTGELPGLLAWVQEVGRKLSGWLKLKGIDAAPLRDELILQVSSRAGAAVSDMIGVVRRAAGGVGRVFISPLLAFYLLRDRGRIAAWLTLLLPVSCRARGVRAAREMRRESAAYLRGQLLLSLAVGLLTALGLLLTGTPGWLLLGLLMGVLEMVPYIGPVLAGIPAVLFALQDGWMRALWTLAVLFGVQQLEGAFLSPRLLAGATQLHPMAVLLLISGGGILLGPVGMVIVLPVVVALRGALRGWRI